MKKGLSIYVEQHTGSQTLSFVRFRSCVCNDNYGGFDCSRCKFGWQGDNCQERRPLAVRKNLLNMTEEEQSNFLDILDQSKTAPHPDYVIAQDHYRFGVFVPSEFF